MVLEFVLLADVLVLFAGVRQFDDGVGDLLAELVQFLITLLDLLVEGLVLDLELLEIDQVKTVSQLLLLLVDLVEVLVAIAQRNVLETVLVNFTVLQTLVDLPSLDHRLLQFLAGAGENGVLGNGVLQSFELSLDFLALALLLIEFGLKLRSHLIVAILSFLQIKANLMHIGQSVKVLMLVKHSLALLFIVTVVVVHQVDLLLKVIVGLLKLFVFLTLVLNRNDQFLLHFGSSGQVTDAAIVVFFVLLLEVLVVVELRVFLTAGVVGARAVLG